MEYNIKEVKAFHAVCPYCNNDGSYEEDSDRRKPYFKEKEHAKAWLYAHLKECNKNPNNEKCKNCINFDLCLLATGIHDEDNGYYRICNICHPGKHVIIRYDSPKPFSCNSFKKKEGN